MIPADLENKIKALAAIEAERVYRELATRFGVAVVPRHTHSGGPDAPSIPYESLHPFYEHVYWTIPGIQAATATNYGVFWVAPADCSLVAAQEVHQTAGSSGSDVTLQIEKLTQTEAPGAGIDMLFAPFNLKGTANTLQTADIVTTGSGGVQDAAIRRGDRLCLADTGTLTAVANVTVLLTIRYQ